MKKCHELQILTVLKLNLQGGWGLLLYIYALLGHCRHRRTKKISCKSDARRDVSPVNYISPVSSGFSKLCGCVVTIDAHKMMCQGLKRAKPCHHIPFLESRFGGTFNIGTFNIATFNKGTFNQTTFNNSRLSTLWPYKLHLKFL